MWGSRIKLIICRKLISHYTKVGRFTSVSAAIQTSPTFEQQLLPISIQIPPITSYEQFHELDTVGVLEILNNLKLEPDQALSFFRQVKDYECCNDIKCYSSIVRILSGSGFERKLASLFLELIESKEKYPHFDVSALFDTLDESSEYSGDGEQSTSSPMNQVFNVLVKTYADLGMFDDAIDALFQTGMRGFVPRAKCCNYIMNCLVECGKTDMALALFQHLKKRLGFTPDVYSYTIVIKAYCRKGDLEEAVDVFRDMDEAGITDAYARTTLVDGLRLNGKTTSGYEVLRAWREAGLLVDAYGYNAVIRGFCSEKKLQEAESVLQDMRNLGVPRDTYSYSNLICGYCEIGDILKAFSIHKDMVSDGVKSNCFIASVMLQCLCKMGLTAEVVDYFQWFKDSGMFLDEVSYNIVIDACCKLGEMQEAEDLLDEMKGKRMVPDAIHYTCLINGYCRQQELQSALDILKEMKDLGVKADIITYNILLGEMYKHGYAGAANDLFEFMEAQGLKANNDTYCAIIKGLCKGGMIKEAREFLNSLEEKCVITCSAMVNGYCEADHTQEAHRLFVSLLSKYGILVSKRACLNLLDKLCMEGNMNAALEAFEKMWGLGLTLDEIAYSKLIAALCRYGNTKKARAVFDILLSSGFTLDAQTYTTIMNGYCKENCLREATDLFNDMKEKGIRPDVVTYTVLIKGALEENRENLSLKKRKANLKTCNSFSLSEGTEGKVLDACALQSEVNIMDIRHDVVYYTVLIDGHCKMNNLQDAVRLFEEMMDRGITPDAIAYTALVSGYCRRGDVDSAVRLVDEMTSKGIMADTPTISALLDGYEIVEARKVKLRPDKQERTQ